MDIFQRAIYPIWASIENKTKASADWDETDMIHKIDIAVFNCGEKPGRLAASDISRMKKSEEQNQKYREAYGR